MQQMLAYKASDVGIASLMALSIVVAGGIAIAGVSKFLVRRAVREFARFPCPNCGAVLGGAAARTGKDVSPFEELYRDGERAWNCVPMYWKVQCGACAHEYVLRLNRRGGERCGPRLSVVSDDSDGGSAAA